MSLQTQITAAFTRIGTEIKSVRATLTDRPIICAWNGTAWLTQSGSPVPTSPSVVRFYDSTQYTTGVTTPTWYNPLDKWSGNS